MARLNSQTSPKIPAQNRGNSQRPPQTAIHGDADHLKKKASTNNKTVKRITEQTHQVFLKVTDLTNKIYTNQTGHFPVISSRSFKYIMTAYVYETTNILVEPMESCSGFPIKTAHQKIRQLLSKQGLQPKLHILDNECSHVFKDYMENENKLFQLVPPHLHRRNATEKAMEMRWDELE